jgi:hypothetical protein
MSKEHSTSLEAKKVEFPSVYRVTTLPPDRIGEVVKENLGGSNLKFTDLQMFGGTTGGKAEWTVDTGAGRQSVKEIRGIVIYHTTEPRSYYATIYDPKNNTPPDCSSWDGVTGYGNPGGDCATCMMNQFGSAQEGKRRGKACKEKHLLFVLREKDLIPCVLSPATTSLRSVQNFFLDLVNQYACFYYEVEARFWMTESEVNGYPTAILNGAVVRQLSEEEIAKISAYRQSVIPVLKSAAPKTIEPF